MRTLCLRGVWVDPWCGPIVIGATQYDGPEMEPNAVQEWGKTVGIFRFPRFS